MNVNIVDDADDSTKASSKDDDECKQEQHIPCKCKEMFDESSEFEVIPILPNGMFEESDFLDRDFRIATGQFLRINT